MPTDLAVDTAPVERSAKPADDATPWSPAPEGPLGRARGFGVMIGGSAALLAVAAASAALVTRALARGERPPAGASAAVAGAAAYALAVRPWLVRWGTRPGEAERPLPGDETVPGPAIQQTRAISIDAPPERVWPWVAQIGQDRAGFYSYRRLENLAGCRMPDVREIRPEWQQRRVGETVPLHPSAGIRVLRFDPGHALVLERWHLVVEEDGPGRSRLYARSRTPRDAGALGYVLLFELPHFVMERRMLLGIKERAERAYQESRRDGDRHAGGGAVSRRPLSRTAILFRVAHAAIAGGFLAAIADVWWCALGRRRNRALRPAVAALVTEGVVVAANRGDCPLGSLQARAGDPVPLFELVLSPTAAKRAVPALGAVAAAGIALLARDATAP